MVSNLTKIKKRLSTTGGQTGVGGDGEEKI